ncbi:MAG: STAS domain-containing protein [Pyrinomonadaceae bacterium]
MINLYIKERQLGDVTVLDLRGRVRVGGATVALHKSFRSLVQEGKVLIILNLADVTHIDSSGLGELISSHISVFNKGGEIKLVQLTETLRELMRATKLLTIFDFYENEADALLSFRDHAVSVKGSALAFA